MQLFETPENRLPPGSVCHEVKTTDGVKLRALVAPSLTGNITRGTMLVMNGRADFMERYFETMRDIQARGFHVVGFDWRGQGGSQRLLRDPVRGYVRSFRQYDEDLRAVMADLVLKQCPGPYYAIAHSTGGHILLRNLLERSWFSRVMVTAPLLELRYGNWPKVVAFTLSSAAIAAGMSGAYLPGFKRGPYLFSGFQDNPLTSDPRRWARDMHTLESHPSLGVGGPTYGWLNATMRSLKELHSRKYRRGLTCPVMIVLAGREKVVDNVAARSFAETVPGVAVVTVREALHEIMLENDNVRGEFFAAFDSYFSA